MKLDQKGQLTAEFLFAIVIAFGLFSLFFAMTLTFSVIEVSQYIVYSTARTHAASNLNMLTQKQEAIKKFNSLKDSTNLASLYSNNWFIFGPIADNMIRQGTTDSNFFKEFANVGTGSDDQYKKVFVGVSVPLEAKIMTMKIPFISGSGPDDDTSVFKTNVNTMLLREISQEECQQAHWGEGRRQALKGLKSGTNFYQEAKYHRMEDNGC